jgi:NADP-dependent 3-hydroxy acid dehydrogenase YdfG
MSATIEGRAVLVAGANRGIGEALVEEALRRGAKRVYAGTRQASKAAVFNLTQLLRALLGRTWRDSGNRATRAGLMPPM